MPQMTLRVAAAVVVVAVGIVVTEMYYTQTVECLVRLEKLAHVAIPAALAVGLLYRIVKNITNDNE